MIETDEVESLPGKLPWISLEGVNGVGKTHLARQVAAQLGEACLLVSELPDSEAGTLPAAIIATLRRSGDLFLRTGQPLTETLLLSALQVYRWESLTAPAAVQLVLEDRGPYSVAVYQAAVIFSAAPARGGEAVETALTILDLIARWRPLPEATVLLRDDPVACLRRFERRIGRVATDSERRLMARAGDLYQELASIAGEIVHVVDLAEVSEQRAMVVITDLCLRLAEESSTGRDPACPNVP